MPWRINKIEGFGTDFILDLSKIIASPNTSEFEIKVLEKRGVTEFKFSYFGNAIKGDASKYYYLLKMYDYLRAGISSVRFLVYSSGQNHECVEIIVGNSDKIRALPLIFKTLKESHPKYLIEDLEKIIYKDLSILTIDDLKQEPIDQAIDLALAAPLGGNYNLPKELLDYFIDKRQQQQGVATLDQMLRLAESIPSKNNYFKQAREISLKLRSEKSVSNTSPEIALSLNEAKVEEDTKHRFRMAFEASLPDADLYYSLLCGNSILDGEIHGIRSDTPAFTMLLNVAEKMSEKNKIISDLSHQLAQLKKQHQEALKSLKANQSMETKAETKMEAAEKSNPRMFKKELAAEDTDKKLKRSASSPNLGSHR